MITTWEEVEVKQNSVRLFAIVNTVLSIVAVIVGLYRLVNTGNPAVLLLAPIPVGILWWIYSRRLKDYKAGYKNVVVNRAAEGLFDSFQYCPEKGYSKEEIIATGLMAMGNIYKSEDTLEGSYKGVAFRRADTYIAQMYSTGKSCYVVEFLRGTWLTFTYNKEFLSDLQIRTKGFRYANEKKSKLLNTADERRHSFETENMEFNKAFECSCQSDSEAFYLLTPQLIQMLLLLRDEFGCDFMLGFVDNRLHFAINSGNNNMEPPVLFGTSMEYEVETVRRELKIITNIVDTLAIDRKIFTA